MKLASLVDAELIFPQLEVFDIPTLLRSLAERIAAHQNIADAGPLFEALWEREQLGSTGIGQGIAVPHCKLDGLGDVVMAVAHTTKPIDFSAVDGKPVQLCFTVVSPRSNPAAHLQCLAAISGWIQSSGAVEDLIRETDPAAMYAMLTERS
ncbi:MAG: PTS sugar transporter subunit IIA [Acidobacteriota bacterium]